MVIARISARISTGHDRALEAAANANEAGWHDVHVDAEPVYGTYVVSADEPDATGR